MLVHRTPKEIRETIELVKGNSDNLEYENGFLHRLEEELSKKNHTTLDVMEETSEYLDGRKDADKWLEDDSIILEFSNE